MTLPWLEGCPYSGVVSHGYSWQSRYFSQLHWKAPVLLHQTRTNLLNHPQPDFYAVHYFPVKYFTMMFRIIKIIVSWLRLSESMPYQRRCWCYSTVQVGIKLCTPPVFLSYWDFPCRANKTSLCFKISYACKIYRIWRKKFCYTALITTPTMLVKQPPCILIWYCLWILL